MRSYLALVGAAHLLIGCQQDQRASEPTLEENIAQMQEREFSEYCRANHEKYKDQPGAEGLADIESCMVRMRAAMIPDRDEINASRDQREREAIALQRAPCTINGQRC